MQKNELCKRDQMQNPLPIAIIFSLLLPAGCGSDEKVTNSSNAIQRGDDAFRLEINLSGSLQTPQVNVRSQPDSVVLYFGLDRKQRFV